MLLPTLVLAIGTDRQFENPQPGAALVASLGVCTAAQAEQPGGPLQVNSHGTRRRQ